MIRSDKQETKSEQGTDGGFGESPFSAIAMPKGGGAIQGIGEKLTVSQMTGTASLQIPVHVTPGRSGFSPELTLSYDSGSGNGPFGLGWSLSVPSITRKTDKGLPQYRDGEQSDTFLLSGVEDLVPVADNSGGGFEWVETESGSFKISLYRPRIEGAFTRIERWVHADTGELHWRTISGHNTVHVFGRSPDCRIADPKDASKVYSWLLEESSDNRGNLIHYVYKQENGEGIDRSMVWEKNRSVDANRYLKRIFYGNQIPYVRGGWLFQVVFDYGEHDTGDPAVEEQRSWLVRKDAFSSFRPGFELRTYRLCRRILMFHQMDALGDRPYLVRSDDLSYSERTDATLLADFTRRGYKKDPATGSLSAKATPPIELEYSSVAFNDAIHTIQDADAENAPIGLDGAVYRWTDLDSEGISGILTEQAEAWYYKRNLGDGTLAPLEAVAAIPSGAKLSGGKAQLMDLAGDGRTYAVQLGGQTPGYQARNHDDSWEPFTAFPSQPHIPWNDPSLRFIDLTGDGHADLVLSDQNVFTFYRSLAKEGYDHGRQQVLWDDEDKSPVLLFADSAETVFLADFNGDGLTDIVRIRCGEVCYWPNMGYGNFGAKVTMDSPPQFDYADQFDPKRIKLFDIDGTGPADILYLGSGQITVWLNQSGNGWSSPVRIDGLPQTNALSTISVVDFHGNGTACIVWSSSLSVYSRQPMRYIDLMGGCKPNLLTVVRNNIGAESTIEYSVSTRFYLQDRAAGTPWVTKLPFPVHVVERMSVYDRIGNTRLVTKYAYHHGYYDGTEREFRGFGMVEQWDTEELSYLQNPVHGPIADNLEEATYVAPILTKTWYHTGASFERHDLARQYAKSYFCVGSEAEGEPLLPDPSLPEGLNAQELREACRALKGSMLRKEIYAEDGSARIGVPYSVSEQTYFVHCVQPQGSGKHAVFHPRLRESVDYQYERDQADPRISHRLSLAYDEYGNVLQSAEIGYGRRLADPLLSTQEQELQRRTKIVYQKNKYTNGIDLIDVYRTPQLWETRTYEWTGLNAPDENGGLFSLDQLLKAVGTSENISYECEPNGTLQTRLIDCSRSLYYNDDLAGPLDWGQLGSSGLTYTSYRMAYTPGLLEQVFAGKGAETVLEGTRGYVLSDGAWWASSGRTEYDKTNFYLPFRFIDPYGAVSIIAYDEYRLLVRQSIDPAGSVTTAVSDYRVMQPDMVTDPNGNRSAAVFDELGVVISTALMGKEGQSEGDTLEEPTTVTAYDLFQWMSAGKPNYVHSMQREEHGNPNGRWQHTYVYSDGFSREIMKKVKAGPDLTRWAATGRTLWNNKGNAVKQYEPYYSATHLYEDDLELRQWGVTPIMEYDPLGRLTGIRHPNGTFNKVEFHAWHKIVWDENDTAPESRWYAERMAPGSAESERRAAKLTELHAGTFSLDHFDAQGRIAISSVQNGEGVWVRNRTHTDIRGNVLSVTDARGFTASEQRYDMLNRPVYSHSPDAGERWTLHRAAGEPIREWNSRGYCYSREYDALKRMTHLFAAIPASEQLDGELSGIEPSELLLERIVYGESLPLTEVKAGNMLGKVYRHYDQSGVLTNESYDFKGNPVHMRRQLTAGYKSETDWSLLAGISDPRTMESLSRPLLETEEFVSTSRYDAMNRLIHQTAPDPEHSEVGYAYNDAGLLNGINVRIRDDSEWTSVVANIEYDAKGQRTLIDYGNGVQTAYEYAPDTFRLTRALTTRPSAGPVQDLRYTYDPVGNIVELRDHAQQTVYFDNTAVEPHSAYEYDALYRLVYAEGREHAGQNTDAERDHAILPRRNVPHVNDAQSMRRYTERYEYDAVGNLLRMIHRADGANWTRNYSISDHRNRMESTRMPQDPADGPYSGAYGYDEHGNMTSMPHLRKLGWNAYDRLGFVELGGGGAAYYVYDATGKRVRAVVERSDVCAEERIYLGHFEIYRKRTGGGVKLERQTLHMMDGDKRVAMIETKTVDADHPVFKPASVIRFQHSDHAESSRAETDHEGRIISCEEYHPFGTTSYHAVSGSVEVSLKRYRHAGKELDEETGLYDYGSRYYASWLGRWISCDPAGFVDGTNMYAFVRNNPVTLSDKTGMYAEAGHFYTVYFVSLAAGFSPEVAYRNAFYAQMPDEVHEFDAKELEIDYLSSFRMHAGAAIEGVQRKMAEMGRSLDDTMRAIVDLPPNFGSIPLGENQSRLIGMKGNRDNVQTGLHTLTGGSSAYERSFRESNIRNLTPGTLEFGFNLHAYGDSFAHSTFDNEGVYYEPGIGHAVEVFSSRISGTSPDEIVRRKELYYDYVDHLYQVLSEMAKAQGLTPRLSREKVREMAEIISFRRNDQKQIEVIRALTKVMMGVEMKEYSPELEDVLHMEDFASRHPKEVPDPDDALQRGLTKSNTWSKQGSMGR